MIILQDIYSFHSYFKYFTITQSVFEHFGCILKGYNMARCNRLIYFQNGLTTNQVRSLSCPCDSCWNPVIPVELFLAESPAKIAIPGTIYSSRIEPFWNWHWNGPGMDQNGIWQNAVFFFFFCKYQ